MPLGTGVLIHSAMPPSKRRASPGASSADAAWPRAAPACCAALIGASGLLGWWLGVPSLQSVLPSLPAMRPNVALGLMAAGSGLLLIPGGGRGWRPGLASAAGALACLLGLLTLAEHMVLVPRGLDQRLAAGSSTPLAIDPGRMSPAAAVALGCAGAAVVLLAWAARAPHSAGSRRAAGLAHLLAAVPAAVTYLSLASHAYAVAGLDGFGPFAAAALNTAVAL
ncbi:MAG: hypothetical protein JOY66_17110, partial [Acetobacteraceae bacterium]|nr:hypothetical protein [Acetobacteraceae bacterium]